MAGTWNGLTVILRQHAGTFGGDRNLAAAIVDTIVVGATLDEPETASGQGRNRRTAELQLLRQDFLHARHLKHG